jgi:hypothetical protein
MLTLYTGIPFSQTTYTLAISLTYSLRVRNYKIMLSKKWIWALALCTGSVLTQTSHALAASLTYNLNFFDVSNSWIGTGSFSSNPTISQDFTLNPIGSSCGFPTDIITVTGIVNQFSATVSGVSFQYPSYGGRIWWDPTDTNSTHQLKPLPFLLPFPEFQVVDQWVITESQGGSLGYDNALAMSGGSINPNSLWGGSFQLFGGPNNSLLNTNGTWTASLQNLLPRVPELADELMDLMGGIVLIGGVLGAKRLQKLRA